MMRKPSKVMPVFYDLSPDLDVLVDQVPRYFSLTTFLDLHRNVACCIGPRTL